MRFMTVPGIEVETNAGVREVSLHTRLFSKRKIFLNEEINSETANNIVAQLMCLQESSDEPIDFYINSPGGSVTAGLVIYDMIQGMTVPINMYCTGMAASMAAIILAGGQKGRRYILPHSKTMIHEPLIDGGVGGSATSIHNISESIMETKRILNEILIKHTGKNAKEIEQATAFDNYMNAQESIDFGICDEICNRI